jgi:nicotinamidase-related amidase
MFSSPGCRPHEGEAAVSRIRGLVDQARRAGAPVTFVMHDGGPGDPLEAGSPGFPLRRELSPLPGESVVIKTACDVFEDTDIDQALSSAGVDRLIVCGMQTEFCVHAAVRTAARRGYQVVLVEDAHTTFDSPDAPAAEIIARENRVVGEGLGALARAEEIHFGG